MGIIPSSFVFLFSPGYRFYRSAASFRLTAIWKLAPGTVCGELQVRAGEKDVLRLARHSGCQSVLCVASVWNVRAPAGSKFHPPCGGSRAARQLGFEPHTVHHKPGQGAYRFDGIRFSRRGRQRALRYPFGEQLAFGPLQRRYFNTLGVQAVERSGTRRIVRPGKKRSNNPARKRPGPRNPAKREFVLGVVSGEGCESGGHFSNAAF